MSIETTFHPLKIAEVRRETPDAISVCFETPPPNLALTYRFQAGQYLTLRATLDGEEVRRNYSVCASPLDGELRVAIKRVAGGRFSAWANSVLAAGDHLDVMAPQGHFVWPFDPATKGRYLAIAGGSGITPILSMLRTALAVEPNSHLTLLYGNRASSSIMFLEEIAGLKNRYMDRLAVFHFLEQESGEVELFNGSLDAERCAAALDALVDVAALDTAFICGPAPMMDAAADLLLGRGMRPDRVMVERFAAAGSYRPPTPDEEAIASRAAGAELTVLLEGRRTTLRFDPAKGAVLDNVRAAGLAAPYACKGGVCATCRAKIVEGAVSMKVSYGLTAAELEAGYVLTCQSVPTTPTVTLSYDD